MTTAKKILMYLWQLPQNIVGLSLLLCLRFADGETSEREYGGFYVCYSRMMRGGVSLGRYIFLDCLYYGHKTEEEAVRHEIGHCRQSMLLGWLYLLLIGIPSIIHAALYQYNPSDPHGYYQFYTEKWADKLGGIKRKI